MVKYNEPESNKAEVERNRFKRGRIELTNRIWSIKARELFDTLPGNIKNTTKISSFKNLLRSWIKTNIPLEETDGAT